MYSCLNSLGGGASQVFFFFFWCNKSFLLVNQQKKKKKKLLKLWTLSQNRSFYWLMECLRLGPPIEVKNKKLLKNKIKVHNGTLDQQAHVTPQVRLNGRRPADLSFELKWWEGEWRGNFGQVMLDKIVVLLGTHLGTY